jgi:hypothetical protein
MTTASSTIKFIVYSVNLCLSVKADARDVSSASVVDRGQYVELAPKEQREMTQPALYTALTCPAVLPGGSDDPKNNIYSTVRV